MGKCHFHIECKEPTHSLLPSSQIIHTATHGVSTAAWRGCSRDRFSCQTLLHHVQQVPLREEQLKIAHNPVIRPVRLGFYSHPSRSTVTGIDDSSTHLKPLQAAFAGSCLGLKTSVMFPVQSQGTQKVLSHWGEKQRCSSNGF